MTRRVVGSAVLALAAALLTGCSSPKDDGPESGDEYVALGDSYTAATNTGPIEQPPDGCGRSTSNYPHQVAKELGMELADVSCNGASTRELTAEQTRAGQSVPPQLNAISAGTKLVTIGLGGNDSYFLAQITNCANYFAGQDGSPCKDLDDKAGAKSTTVLLPQVEDNLVAALREIRDRAPDARIVVVGYPQLFPAEGTCDLVPLPSGDYAWARSVVERLNAALAAAAQQEDVTYVDVAGPSKGHDICSDDPWIAGNVVVGGGSSPWHPYAEEVDAVADLVVAAVNQDG